MFRSVALTLAASFAVLLSAPVMDAQAQQTDSDKHLDIRSSAGDLHLGNDADIRDVGLPLYPGARLKHDEESKNSANIAIATAAFGMKLVVLSYDSEDAPDKVIGFYRDKLKKYGKVIECRTSEHGGDINVNEGKDDSNGSKQVTCGGDNTGKVIELKVGTQDHQHLVSVEPSEKGSGSTFALVYVRTRGKQGDI
ncbi:MAG TPA: hypothetical protein VNW47_01225 [Terriglobales bacterium]|jgi:hypothetical protein|nr:hypothetical protein [Terriglobales bacterium]